MKRTYDLSLTPVNNYLVSFIENLCNHIKK